MYILTYLQYVHIYIYIYIYIYIHLLISVPGGAPVGQPQQALDGKALSQPRQHPSSKTE